MKKITVSVCLAVLMISMAGITPALADGQEPEPLYRPTEFGVYPSSQTVFTPSYRAVWQVGISGDGTNYCIQVTWGDGCGTYRTCGYTEGIYTIYHDFTCGGSSPYYQSWMLYNGPDTPKYDSSVVYK